MSFRFRLSWQNFWFETWTQSFKIRASKAARSFEIFERKGKLLIPLTFAFLPSFFYRLLKEFSFWWTGYNWDQPSRSLNNTPLNCFLLTAHSWHLMPYLKSLDISWNPLRVLTKESFQGLVRVQDLVVQYLPDLKRFDADSLSHLHYLTNLAIQVGSLDWLSNCCFGCCLRLQLNPCTW